MTEPDAGSAVTDLKTSARQDGAHYVVNGGKVFSTFSAEAQIFLVYLRYGPGLNGIGSVLIERGTPGFSIGKPSAFMSGEEWCELHFADCRIPAENVCSARAASANRWRASTSSGSATRRARWPTVVTRSIPRATMR